MSQLEHMTSDTFLLYINTFREKLERLQGFWIIGIKNIYFRFFIASARKKSQVYIEKNVPVDQWLYKKLLVYGHVLVGIQIPFRSDIKESISTLYMA